MLIGARTAAWSGGGVQIPYQRVEWIESIDSLNYIDTGVKPSADSVTDISFIPTVNVNQQGIYGTWRTANAYSLYQNGTGYFSFGVYDPKASSTWNPVGFQVRNYLGSVVRAYIDTKEKKAFVEAGGEVRNIGLYGVFVGSNYNIGLFCKHQATNVTARLRICRFMHTNDGVLACDLYPVRFTNEIGVEEGAMYDLVSGRLLRNNGSTALVIGPDK